MDSRQIERTAAEWLAKLDAGDWSDADQAVFDAWLAESTSHRVAWLRLSAAWKQSDRLKALGGGVAPGHIPERGQWMHPISPGKPRLGEAGARQDRGPSRHNAKLKRHHLTGYAAVAAALVLSLSTIFLWRQYGAEEQAHYYTDVGSVQDVSLVDGSKATLGSDSYLEITVSRNRRQVNLERGEAYFDVAHDPARTFVVDAGSQRVVAIGTRFSVRRENERLRVVVTEGRVRLESIENADRPPALLTAGMVAESGETEALIREYPIERVNELLGWRQGFLIFRDTPLAEVVAEFNRYTRRKLVIDDPAIANVLVGGNFRWSNIDAFIRLLEQGFDIHAEEREQEILLRGQ